MAFIGGHHPFPSVLPQDQSSLAALSDLNANNSHPPPLSFSPFDPQNLAAAPVQGGGPPPGALQGPSQHMILRFDIPNSPGPVPQNPFSANSTACATAAQPTHLFTQAPYPPFAGSLSPQGFQPAQFVPGMHLGGPGLIGSHVASPSALKFAAHPPPPEASAMPPPASDETMP